MAICARVYKETLNKDNDNMFASSLVEDCIMYTLRVLAYELYVFGHAVKGMN